MSENSNHKTRWLLPLKAGGILCPTLTRATEEALHRKLEPGGIRQISGAGNHVAVVRRGTVDISTGLYPSVEAARAAVLRAAASLGLHQSECGQWEDEGGGLVELEVSVYKAEELK